MPQMLLACSAGKLSIFQETDICTISTVDELHHQHGQQKLMFLTL
jgi:hypothetical protein